MHTGKGRTVSEAADTRRCLHSLLASALVRIQHTISRSQAQDWLGTRLSLKACAALAWASQLRRPYPPPLLARRSRAAVACTPKAVRM